MIFNTPNRSLRQLSRAGASPFSLEVFRVSDDATQQVVLLALRRFRRRGARALGTRWQSETFVVVDCRTEGDSASVRRVVLGLDPNATITFSSGQRDQMGLAL